MSKDKTALVVIRSTAAGIAAGAAIIDPVAGVTVAAAIPVLEEGGRRVLEWRKRNMSRVLDRAGSRSEKGVEDLVDDLTKTPSRLALLSEVLAAAELTALELKLEALAEALANGALGHEAAVESERRWVAMLAGVEEFHLLVLDVIARRTSQFVGHPALALGHESQLPDLIAEVDILDDLRKAGVDPVLCAVFVDDLVTSGLVEREGDTRNMSFAEPKRTQGNDDPRRLLGLRLLRFTPAGLEIYGRLQGTPSSRAAGHQQ